MGGAVVKGGYRIYVPYRATICKLCGRLYPKHIRKRSDFFELAASHIQPGTLSVVDLTVFGMEEGHVRQGSRHVFVENLKLLEMLQSAHMDVGEDNLGIKTGEPKLFAIDWPTGSIELGVAPCLVFQGTRGEFAGLKEHFLKNHVKGYKSEGLADPSVKDQGLFAVCIEVSVDADNPNGSYMIASIPTELIRTAMSSGKAMLEVLPTFGRGVDPLVHPLSSRDARLEYNTVNAALRLIVYMRACPWLVRSGYPSGDAADLPRYMSVKPDTVGLPKQERGSPETHWRTWHFRPYPRKADGSRRDGLVFVNGTVVGAKVTAETVVTSV